MDADTNQIKTRRPRIRKPAEYYQSEEYKQEQSEYQKKQEIKIILHPKLITQVVLDQDNKNVINKYL